LKITLLTSTMSSAAGGLSASVPPLAHQIASDSNLHVDVVGVQDSKDPEAATEWGPHVYAHTPRAPHAFRYAPGMNQTLARLAPDIIDAQGLWTYPSLVNLRHHRQTGIPYIVTPRGMLDLWARRRSYLKKKLVRLWFEDAHLRNAACLRATAAMEAEHFRSFGLHQPIAIVPNGVDTPPLPKTRLKSRETKRLLFLSRIHPKKGLPYLLKAWAMLAPHRPDWELVIAGSDELNHTAEMRKLASRLHLPRIVWYGPVHGAEKQTLYRSADLFVLPTHAENFGLVIAEALAHGVPVITTRNAPWSGLVDQRCGRWIELSEANLYASLMEITAMPDNALQAMGARGHAWMERDFSWKSVGESMAELYEWVTFGGTPPAFVALP
jgi:glycosyltransferase involved in cell wall biosynthesis